MLEPLRVELADGALRINYLEQERATLLMEREETSAVIAMQIKEHNIVQEQMLAQA
jgi:hypothetical protein